MKDLFKKIVKGALIWFAAGALFALGANAIAPLLGGGEIATLAQTINPLWIGSLLGGTSILSNLIEPIVSGIFGDKKAADQTAAVSEKSEGKQVNVTITQSPQQSQSESTYRQTIEAERIAIATGEKTVGV